MLVMKFGGKMNINIKNKNKYNIMYIMYVFINTMYIIFIYFNDRLIKKILK